MTSIPIELHDDYKLLLSYSNRVNTLVLSAGIGYGKSHGSVIFTHMQVLRNGPNKSHLILGPNHSLLKDQIMETYVQMLERFGYVENVDFVCNKSSLLITYLKYNVKVLFKSYKSGIPNLTGFNLISINIEEAGDMPNAVWREINRRFRGKLKDSQKITMLITGVPQGSDLSHWYLKMLLDTNLKPISYYKIEDQQYVRFKADSNTIVMFGSSHEGSKWNGKDYVDRQYKTMPKGSNLAKQQLHGLAVAASSEDSLFKLKGSNLKDISFDPENEDTIIVSLDFNIEKSGMLVMQTKEGVYQFVYDNKARAMDSYELAYQILEFLPPEKYQDCDIVITGDASGSKRSTTTQDNRTDWDIIKKVLYGKYRNLTYSVPRSNPSVSNSVKNFNRLLVDNLVEISKEHCSELIHCLSSVEKTANNTILKSSADSLSHLVDCARYAIEVVEPSRKKHISGSI